MAETMDISEYIPARIRNLQQRKQELSLEIVRVEAAIAELLNMVTPQAETPEIPEAPVRVSRKR